jgi:hypothetical protein
MLIFQTEITDKYPGYQPPKLPFHVTSPLTIQASLPLAAAMSYANATNQVELLYQTLFPPKATTTTTVAKKPQHPLLQNFETIKDSPALALPLTYEGSHVPKSVEEAGQVYLDNLHVSLANYQLIEERSRVLHRWQHQHQKQQEDIAKEKSLLERIYVSQIKTG